MVERVIFITGDTESRKTAEFLVNTGCLCLAKPFAISEMLDLIAEVSLKVRAV